MDSQALGRYSLAHVPYPKGSWVKGGWLPARPKWGLRGLMVLIGPYWEPSPSSRLGSSAIWDHESCLATIWIQGVGFT